LFTAIPTGGGEPRLFRMNGDGGGLTQLTRAGIARAPFCTPDSKKVYFTLPDEVSNSMFSLWSVPLAGGTPQKELELHGFGSFLLTRDVKFAEMLLMQDLAGYIQILDLASRRIVHRIPLDMSSPHSTPSFSPDGKAIVERVTSQGGNALKYQPIDGSTAHLLFEPTHDALTDFAWSPSGSKLGVLQLRKSSDVVLITDLTGKQPR
jgi:Tol biopolymer transport system component